VLPDPRTLEIDVSAVAPPGGHSIAVDIFLPSTPVETKPVLWWLQPGGGMSRRYWDLDVPAELGNYSAARHLARNGYVTITVDHLGVGGSSRPHDGFTLTPQVLADVNAHAFDHVLHGLRAGTLLEGVDAMPELVSIGAGHSMGASLTVHQQARHHSHRAVCLLGFGGQGLLSHLTDDEKRLVNDPEALRRQIVALVKARYPDPLPMMPRGSSEFLVAIPMAEPVHEALVEARTNLLALAGFSSMIPGNAAPEIAAIDVPVMIAHGDKDIGAPIHEVVGDFTASNDVTLYVLEESGHNHNVSPNRERLWNRMLSWAAAVL
jgi:pimeloyl-ACP methyl ester carboxylesterase